MEAQDAVRNLAITLEFPQRYGILGRPPSKDRRELTRFKLRR